MSDSTFNWDNYLEVASISDVGMRRATNQDNLNVTMASNMQRWQQFGHLFLVADGMGAHAAGELASEIAADKIPYLYTKYQDMSAPEALRQAVADGNAEIHRKGQANEDFYNMGTTCSVLTLLPQGALIAHVGDSRVYRLRNNQLEQLTFDHSLVWEMRASGNLSAEDEKANVVPKNVITRSLGPYSEVKIDLEGPFPIEIGDTFLICSDGLTGQVSDEELGPLLANLSAREAARVLVDLSNLRGGPDNISMIIVRVVDQAISTNASSGARPLRVGAKAAEINPVLLGLLAVFGFATFVLWLISGSLFPAVIPGTIALAAGVWILLQWSKSFAGGVSLSSGQRFGRGPYSRTDSLSGKQVISKLETITGDLQRAAVEGKWQIDWPKMNRLVEKANESIKANDQTMAIRCYARSICFLMDQLRQQGKQNANETNADPL
jgi:protein phosphatase